MTKEQKKRFIGLLSKVAMVGGIAIAYALFTHFTGWGIPCLFHLWTGKLCPGCGISRMFLALFRLDFAAAMRYNLLVLCLLPFGIVLGIYKAVQHVKTGNTPLTRFERVFYPCAFVLCVVFYVLRNYCALPFLAMP